jgi:hypothetical protein
MRSTNANARAIRFDAAESAQEERLYGWWPGTITRSCGASPTLSGNRRTHTAKGLTTGIGTAAFVLSGSRRSRLSFTRLARHIGLSVDRHWRGCLRRLQRLIVDIVEGRVSHCSAVSDPSAIVCLPLQWLEGLTVAQ